MGAEKTGFVGPNGCGKSTLAKILVGEINLDQGRFFAAGVVAYLPQGDPSSSGTLAEYLGDVWSSPERGAVRLAQSLALHSECKTLSGGEWMRARLAKILSVSASYLILDEPTNNLDAAGRSFVAQFVKDYPKRLLVISHDRS